MVWGTFSGSGKADLVVMEGKQNIRYINVLDSFMNRLDTNNAIFQQDNATIHTSKLTKDWFKTKNIQVLDWPIKSPDLNPIENLWGILSRRVYKNKHQFEDRETLKSCIKLYWNEIPSETLRTLIDSIQNKCVEVLQLKGNKCKFWILYNFAVKNKFSKPSYTYFHPQKRFFLNNFFLRKVVIKYNWICILIPIGSRYHTQIFRGICAVIRKLLAI